MKWSELEKNKRNIQHSLMMLLKWTVTNHRKLSFKNIAHNNTCFYFLTVCVTAAIRTATLLKQVAASGGTTLRAGGKKREVSSWSVTSSEPRWLFNRYPTSSVPVLNTIICQASRQGLSQKCSSRIYFFFLFRRRCVACLNEDIF